MDTDAKIANAWSSQDKAAQELERVVKNARRLTDRETLTLVKNAADAYIARLTTYLDLKDDSVSV